MARLTCASDLLQDEETNYFLVNSVSAKRKKRTNDLELIITGFKPKRATAVTWVKTSICGHFPALPQHLADKNESI